VSPDSPVHALRVTPSPQVLEVKTSLHLGHLLTGGSCTAASDWAGRATLVVGWAGHPQQDASAFWPVKHGKKLAPERCGFGPDRAH
jgi:hypothetical protein